MVKLNEPSVPSLAVTEEYEKPSMGGFELTIVIYAFGTGCFDWFSIIELITVVT